MYLFVRHQCTRPIYLQMLIRTLLPLFFSKDMSQEWFQKNVSCFALVRNWVFESYDFYPLAINGRFKMNMYNTWQIDAACQLTQLIIILEFCFLQYKYNIFIYWSLNSYQVVCYYYFTCFYLPDFLSMCLPVDLIIF